MVIGLLGNESPDSNRFTLVTPKPENGVRLQATLGNQNPTGLLVRAVSEAGEYSSRSVVGVVETEKEAEKIVDILKRSSSEEVTFTKFNTKQFQTEALCFRVDFNYGDWEVEYVHDAYTYALLNNKIKENYEVYEDCWIIYAATPEQAIKIAQDMRAKRLALKSNL